MLIAVAVLLTTVGIGWYLFSQLRKLARSGIAFGQSLQRQGEAVSQALDVPPVNRPEEPELSLRERFAQAYTTRRRIAEIRHTKRNARLDRARTRWAALTSRSYPRLAAWGQARATVAARKAEAHLHTEEG